MSIIFHTQPAELNMSLLQIHDNLEKPTLKWNTYFETYETHLSKFIGKNPVLLEIGIAKGGSLEMWAKYFQNGEIHGIDANEKIKNHVYKEPNIYCHLGDQGSPEYWEYFKKATDITFDIIIDDGSHVNSHQILTLINLFPRLKMGGVYVIEDTHTSYWTAYGGGIQKPGTFVETVKQLIDFLHRQHIDSQPNPELVDIFKNLKSISFYNSMIVLHKDKVEPMVPYGVHVDPTNPF